MSNDHIHVGDDIERMAVNRYRTIPSGHLFTYNVVAGDGTRSLFSGTKDACKAVARQLTEAFLDGAHVAVSAQPAATPALVDWRIDTSAGRPILVYQNCSVIEAEQAEYVLRLVAADQDGAQAPQGEIVVTWTSDRSRIVAVTRQDEDGKILKVLAQAPGAAGDAPSQAVHDVLAERRHQADIGYDAEHDDEHVNDEIAAAAAFYIMPPAVRDWPAAETGYGDTFGAAIIPDGWHADARQDRRRQLVIGAAMGLAEIERLDRAALRTRREGSYAATANSATGREADHA